MITKYKASTYTYTINKCEFYRETDKCLHLDGFAGHVKKSTSSISYFDDFEAAKNWLLEDANHEVLLARLRLNAATGAYGNVKGLKL